MTAQVAPRAAGTRQEVHVTGRRILATLVDGLVFGLLYAAMAALFGTFQTAGFGHWQATLPAIPTLVYALTLVLIGFLLIPVMAVASVVPFMHAGYAAYRVGEGDEYRYPVAADLVTGN